MKTRRLTIEWPKKHTRGAPLLHCPEGERPTPAYLYFHADRDADTVHVVATYEDGYDDEIPELVASGEIIRVPIPSNAPTAFLDAIPNDPNMLMIVNGIIDKEVLVEYAKYAIEYLLSRLPS